jgi:hypothetical protein
LAPVGIRLVRNYPKPHRFNRCTSQAAPRAHYSNMPATCCTWLEGGAHRQRHQEACGTHKAKSTFINVLRTADINSNCQMRLGTCSTALSLNPAKLQSSNNMALDPVHDDQSSATVDTAVTKQDDMANCINSPARKCTLPHETLHILLQLPTQGCKTQRLTCLCPCHAYAATGCFAVLVVAAGAAAAALLAGPSTCACLNSSSSTSDSVGWA